MMERLSRAKIKFFKALGDKNTREREGLFLAEGRKMVSEGLKEGWKCSTLIGTKDEFAGITDPKSISEAELFTASASEIAEISSLKNPEPLLAVFEIRTEKFDFSASSGLILDGISDPGNLGTLIRTADWFGISQILAGPGTADRFNPKTLRSTMGSVFRLKMSYSPNLKTDLEHFGSKIWLADMKGATPDEMCKSPRPFLLLGNESRGVSGEISAIEGIAKVAIPGKGRAESLNVAVAGGILLFLKS